MKPTLEEMASCFQGLIPATLYTCSADGVPNVAYLSHVDYVDSGHVALSFQFFNKSRRNIAENPQAMVRLIDPDTGQGWQLQLRFVRSETSGPIFERMALRIEAIASYCGLKGIFKLLAADIYAVLTVKSAPEEAAMPHAVAARRAPADAVFTMRALQDFAARIQSAGSLEQLLDSILEGIEAIFAFKHSMILLAGEQAGVLVTIASRGYAQTGVGAEARFGEGIVGMVAEARKPIRISGLMRGMLYALAVKKRAEEAGLCPEDRRIAMPGLAHPESQLGVPLIVRDELVGVLCIESETRYRFHEEDKVAIELLGGYLAIAIQNMLLQERSETAERDVTSAPALETAPAAPITQRLRREEGRSEFTNRELRLDKTLNLPDWKDNLETRLLLLRRRLEQKCPQIRIAPRARGRFALELGCEVTLVEKSG
jgi:GAF domain-containing protein